MKTMKHRHMNTSAWTLAAIDSCITRGTEADHAELRRFATADPEIMQKIRQVCQAMLARENPENFDRNLYQAWLE
jgi:hypothetical protein